MSEFTKMDDQKVVNLVCGLRPHMREMPLDDSESSYFDPDKNRQMMAAEAELLARSYTEKSRGYWESNDPDKPYLIRRPA